MNRPADGRPALSSGSTRASLGPSLPGSRRSIWSGISVASPRRLLPACLLLACQTEPTTPSSTSDSPSSTSGPASGPAFLITDNVVASLTLSPDSQMVFVGDKFKITSRPKNAAGQLLDKVARWTVAAPTIAKQVDSLKAITTFKALKAGATTVKATIDAKSSSAKLVVRSVTGAKVVLTPAQVTVASGATTQFTVTGLTTTGEKPAVNVTWKVTGGTVTTAGLFKAGTVAGTYRVIATSLFGAADTSAITVTATPSPIAKVVLTPASATLASGATVQFAAYGRTQAGDSVAATVSYTATGGTIATTGIYTAGTTPGTYRVIATAATHSDTSDVVISAPPPATAGLTLMPDIAASRPGASTQFTTQVVNASGQTTTSPVQYSATCGGITTDGIYSAPSGASGSCLVIAAAGDKSDTTEVKLLSDSRNRGTPFGIFGLWATSTKVPDPGLALFNASHDNVGPGGLLNQISAARAKG